MSDIFYCDFYFPRLERQHTSCIFTSSNKGFSSKRGELMSAALQMSIACINSARAFTGHILIHCGSVVDMSDTLNIDCTEQALVKNPCIAFLLTVPPVQMDTQRACILRCQTLPQVTVCLVSFLEDPRARSVMRLPVTARSKRILWIFGLIFCSSSREWVYLAVLTSPITSVCVKLK